MSRLLSSTLLSFAVALSVSALSPVSAQAQSRTGGAHAIHAKPAAKQAHAVKKKATVKKTHKKTQKKAVKKKSGVSKKLKSIR